VRDNTAGAAQARRDNLACLDLRLTDDQVRRLDGASQVELGFPHDFYGKDVVRTLAYSGLRDRIDTSALQARRRSLRAVHP
jgi:hypothetical protein